MATKTTAYGYINIPNGFFASKLPASKLLALASVYSLSSEEREQFGFKKKQNRVKFTVTSFSKRYNVSASTSRRALASLETCDKIEKTEEGMYFPADKMKNGKEKGYLHVEEWMFFANFAGEYLTKSEVLVLSRLISLANKGDKVKTSYRYVARGLGLSHTLVMNASDKLERLGIINILSYGRNNYDRTTFLIQKAYLQERKAEMERTLRSGTSEERAQYYTNLRQMAMERRQAMYKKACKDLIFKETYKKWYNKKDDAHLQAVLFERLNLMGMSWHDIQLRFVCDKCKDTGTLPNGKNCNCYEEKMNK